jgi:hypothetical protein
MKLVSKHELKPPGYCVSCNSSKDDKYVCVDFFADFFGEIYLCRNCWINQSYSLGLAPMQHNVEVMERLANLQEAIRGTIESSLEISSDLDGINAHLHKLHTGLASLSAIVTAIQAEPATVGVIAEATRTRDKANKSATQ